MFIVDTLLLPVIRCCFLLSTARCNTLHLKYSFSTHIVEGVDYTVTSSDVFEATFVAGSMIGSTACHNITILDDDDLEGPHNFSMRISGTNSSGSQIMTDAASAIVDIQDNDGICYIIFVRSMT